MSNLNQQKFLWTMNMSNPEDCITISNNGDIIVNLRKEIKITHNYKKSNKIYIIFVYSQDKYEITSNEELGEICKIHMENEDSVNRIYDYCKNNLEKV